jgi:predicted RNA methylase
MKLKELESHLSTVENFSDAKEHLEQYMTTPHLGNRIKYF